MNAETLRAIAIRAAERLGKSPTFITQMLERLEQWHYELDEPAPPIIGGGWTIAAHLNPNVQWIEET